MIVAVIYIFLFSLLIYFAPFFNIGPFNFKRIKGINLVFLLKIAFGLALVWIYTHYYTDRKTADIYKYYDDARIMYSAWQKGDYGDYLRMVFGISNDSPHFDSNYYTKMNHWYRQYDYGTYNDNHTIIRFNALVMPFAFGSFYVHTVFMCFVSLWGLTALYRAFAGFLPYKTKALFIAVFLIPSVLFWGSGVLKEGILLFSLGFFMYSFFQVFIHKRDIVLNLVMLVLAVFLLLINKQYLLIATAPALACFWLVETLRFPKPFLFYLGLYIIGFTVAYFVSLSSERNLAQMLAHKQRDFIALSRGGVFLQNGREFVRIAPDKKRYLDTLDARTFKIKAGSEYMYWKNEDLGDTLYASNSADTATYKLVWDLPLAGSTIEMPVLQPTMASLFRTAPRALYNALAKPGLLSAKTIFERLSSVENALVLLFLMLCTAWCRTGMNKNLFSLCFFISVTILFLIGYTTPIAGAIVRYKVPVLPFVLLCGVIIFDVNKLKFFSDKTKA